MRSICVLATVCSLQFSARGADRSQELAKSQIGREVAITRHLADGEEFKLSITDLVSFGKKLFDAKAEGVLLRKEPENRFQT